MRCLNRIYRKIYALTIFLFGHSMVSPVGALELPELYQRVLSHYPTVLSEVITYQQAQQKERGLLGFSDLQFNTDVASRMSGFYSGDFFSNYISQDFQNFNSNLRLGYRRSSGTFPIYESELETLNNGEVFAALNFNLLRDRTLDPRRLRLLIQKLRVDLSNEKVKLEKINVLLKANEAYWKWKGAIQVRQVYQGLEEMARERDKALAIMVKSGDTAEIYRQENLQYLRQRESQVVKANQKIVETGAYLALFYRDANGKMLQPNETKESKAIMADIQRINRHQSNAWLNERPEITMLEKEIRMAQQELTGAQQALLPRLTTGVELKRDFGEGDVNLGQTEVNANAQFQLFFQNREAKGRRDISSLEIRRVRYIQRLEQDTLSQREAVLWSEIQNAYRVIELARSEQELAKRVEDAEREKWREGDSDFILVNLREQNTAYARIKFIEACLSYHLAKAEYELLIDFQKWVD